MNEVEIKQFFALQMLQVAFVGPLKDGQFETTPTSMRGLPSRVLDIPVTFHGYPN